MNDYLALALGVAAAGAGGELFVRGAVGLARSARVSPGIIGATVAAFATSSPELAVSTSAALAGNPRIALGDALGSNIVNVALILGLAALVSRIHYSGDAVRRDFAVALLAPVIIGVLVFDGGLSKVDGSLLIAVFLAWLTLVVIEARKQRSATGVVPGSNAAGSTILLCLAGLALLAVAGHLVVTGAKGLALSFGIDEFVVGATIVAVGTSVPELATAITAKLRGHDELGLGTILAATYSMASSLSASRQQFLRSSWIDMKLPSRWLSACSRWRSSFPSAAGRSNGGAVQCCLFCTAPISRRSFTARLRSTRA